MASISYKALQLTKWVTNVSPWGLMPLKAFIAIQIRWFSETKELSTLSSPLTPQNVTKTNCGVTNEEKLSIMRNPDLEWYNIASPPHHTCNCHVPLASACTDTLLTIRKGTNINVRVLQYFATSVISVVKWSPMKAQFWSVHCCGSN